jgi:hypothetical protein
MTLRDAIAAIESFPVNATIYAVRIGGAFTGRSEVTVLELSEEEHALPVAEIATRRAPGKGYFLECTVAREVLDGWFRNHQGVTPALDEAVDRLIDYAENDA